MFNYNYPFDFRLLNWGYMSLGGRGSVGMCLDCTGTLPLLSISLWFLLFICLVVEGFFDAKFCFSSLVSL